MNAPALAAPAWLSQVHADAIAVAVLINADLRAAHAAACVWRGARGHGVAPQTYADALRSELETLGLRVAVPLLGEEPSGLTDRYAIRWHASRMYIGQVQVLRGVEIEMLARGARPYYLALGGRYRYAALDGIECAVFEMLRDARMLGAEATDGLRARAAEIRAVVDEATRD